MPRRARRWPRDAGVETPIAEAVVRVLYEDVPPREAIERLMTRALKAE